MACITGLSLTQVSMWFANARRRIKKLGMKAWSKGRCEDEEVSIIANQNQRQSGSPSHDAEQGTGSKQIQNEIILTRKKFPVCLT